LFAIKNRKKFWDGMTGLLMIAPMTLLLSVFAITPLVSAIKVSFENWSFYQPPEFVGFHNYYLVLTDNRFFKSIVVGIKYAITVVSCGFVVAFFFSHVLKHLSTRISSFVKTSIYIPTIISGIIVSMIFMFIFQYPSGLLNTVVKSFGSSPIPWLANPQYALTSISISGIWMGFGFTSLLMLAGLNDIPNSYYEAASLDGAGFLKQMWHITIPSMRNTFVFIVITGFSGALQVFDLPFLMTQGGPLDRTLTPILFIYQHFKNDVTLGYTLAASVVVFIVLGTISAVIFKVIKSEKFVD